METSNMDFHYALPILIAAGSGIAICCTGLSFYLIFLRQVGKKNLS